MLDPREAAQQVMDPGVGSAPALPYSLGPNSPSRHQQHEVEGCSRCSDAVSSDQPLEAVAEFEQFPLPQLKEAHVAILYARSLERH